MGVELHVEAVGVDVEAVRVLHDELAHPQQAGLGSRLVAELGLQVEPDLGQLLVGGQLGGDLGKDLLVGHREQEVGPSAILELGEDALDVVPAAGLLPDLTRKHHRQ